MSLSESLFVVWCVFVVASVGEVSILFAGCWTGDAGDVPVFLVFVVEEVFPAVV